MENSFTIRQDLTFSEFFSSALYYYLSGKSLKRFFLFLLGLSLLSMFLGFLTTSQSVDIITIISTFAPFIILFLIGIIVISLICLYIYKSQPHLFKNVSYYFNHWGVVRHGEQTEFSKPWRDITKFKETKAFFLLYIGSTDFHIIQKRIFENDKVMNDFRNLLNENLN